MEYLFLIGGFLTGATLVWLFLRGKIELAEQRGRGVGDVERTTLTEQLSAAQRELKEVKTRLGHVESSLNDATRETSARKEDLAGITAKVAAEQQRFEALQVLHREAANEAARLRELLHKTATETSELRTTLAQERKQNNEKLELLRSAREDLTNQFKQLANDVLEDKSKRFTEQNKLNLDQLLTPLKEKIVAFQSKVEEVYVKEGKDRSALGEQVKMLTQLNTQLSEDAQNLTLALKGDRKAQGNWGEIILEDVLERGGLIRGQHFSVQEGRRSDDGMARVIPDVVVHLPGNRSIVIDSKLTLPDYQTFAVCEESTAREDALKRHLTAIRAHIKRLSDKKYQTLYGLNSLDCVVMFVPLEPAFMVAVTNDRDLFNYAWEMNILLVSPSTLLFVIRTIASLWRQEDLRQNSQEIARRGAMLYDKLVGFVDDLEKVGERLQQATTSLESARQKFSQGQGNVIRQAEMLKHLGVKPTKNMPIKFSDDPTDEEDRTTQRSSENSELWPVSEIEGTS